MNNINTILQSQSVDSVNVSNSWKKACSGKLSVCWDGRSKLSIVLTLQVFMS